MPKKKSPKKLFMILAIVLVVLFGLWMLWGWFSVRNIEQPTYKVISTNELYEVREYEPQLIAKVTVSGTMDSATNDGFRLIADYIFGNNTTQEAVAMTAPVTVQNSEPIAMTVPVTSTEGSDGTYTIAFVMPSKYTLETLPKPVNPQVVIEEVPSKTYAVLTFSGYTGEKKVDEKEKILFEALQADDIQNSGTATLSQYNPPWTPWFMRRNEIWVELL